MTKKHILLFAFLFMGISYAQTINENMWVTNSTVNSVAVDGGYSYLGGEFTYVGPATGHGAKFTTTNSTANVNFPKVNGSIESVASDSSGGWYIAGSFSKVGDYTRNNIAHINSDGSVDAAWDGNSNGEIKYVTYSGGYVYACGGFGQIGGVTTQVRIAKLNNTDGLADPNFVANINTWTDVVIVDGNYVYAGGNFSTVNGLSRVRLAKISIIDGSLDATWNPNANGRVFSMTISGSDIFVGGSFTNVGGLSRNRIAKLNNTDGSADVNWDANANSTVWSITKIDTNIYVGGNFSSIGGQSAIKYLVKLGNTNGTIDATWNPNANSSVNSLAINGNDIYVAGRFTNIGGQPRNRIAKLSINNNNADATWDPSASGNVLAISLFGSNIYAGGDMNSVGGKSISYLCRLNNTTGLLDESWVPLPNNRIRSIVISGSDIYVGGDFTTIGGQIRQRLAKLNNSNGNADGTWIPNANSGVYTIAMNNNDIYVGGAFTTVGGQTRNRISKLNNIDGSADLSWDANASSKVWTITIDGSNIYAGGDFTSIGGQSRNRIARLNNIDGLADSWNPNANSRIRSIAISGANVYLGGEFRNIGGQALRYLVRTNNTDGSLDTGWYPNSNSSVYKVLINGGIVYAGGTFTTIGSNNLTGLAKLDQTDGTSDGNWHPNAYGTITLAIGGNDLYAGGTFQNVLDNTRAHFVNFTNGVVSNVPSIQASNVTTMIVQSTKVSFGWANGSGAGRAVFMKQTNTGSALPSNNTTYTANKSFGSGTQIGSTGWYCVYNGTGSSVTVSNLTLNTEYKIMVVEYNSFAGDIIFNTTTATNNPVNFTTTSTDLTTQNALKFDGTGDYINLNTVPDLFGSDFTLETWFKLTETSSGSHFIFGLGHDNNGSFEATYVYVTGTRINVGFYGEDLRGGTLTYDSLWHHVAFTFNNTTKEGILYIDGANITSKTFSLGGNGGGLISSTNKGRIGSPSYRDDENFKGELDESRIWSVVRSQTDIQNEMSNTTLSASTPGLLAYYHYNEGTAGQDNTGINILVDETSIGYDGSLNNFALNGSTSNWVANDPNNLFPPISAPTLSSPSNNATGVSLTPTLSWSSVTGADQYRLEVNTASNFSGTVIYDQDTVSLPSKQIGGLSTNTAYYWRVAGIRSSSGQTSTASSVRNFTTAQQSVSGISPSNNSFSNSITPTFSWPTTTGASNYHLEVNTASNFTGTVKLDTTTSATSKTLNGTSLTNNTKYYWRVTASSNSLAKANILAANSFTTKLATTTLSSPANNATGQSLSPTLSWSSVTGATKYRLEVNTASNFSGVAIYDQDTVSLATKQIGGLSDNTKYYWRVTAINSSGNTGDVSSVFNFTIVQSTLTSPSNSAFSVSLAPTLSWQVTTGASKYHLEVNANNSFSGTVIIDDANVATNSKALSGLSNNTTYFWRVTASSNSLLKTNTSTVYSFTTKLATTTLSSPANNVAGQSLSPTLSWSSVTGATKYRLEVNTASNFSGVAIYDQDTVSLATKQIGGLSDNTKYYWRVTAINSSGNTGDVSSVFNFTTVQSTLTSPSNSAFSVSLTPTFSWLTTTGVSTYRLEVNTASNFSGIVKLDTTTSVTSKILNGTSLNNNTVYYWRATASSNSLAKTNSSSVFSFTTKLATTTLSSPANAATGQALNVSLSWLAVTGADRYTLEVNTASNFTGTAIAVSGQPQSGTSKAPGGLSDNTTYYWRVTASNSGTGNTSDASTVRSFTTAQQTVLDIFPPVNSFSNSLTPALSWSAGPTGTDKYRLEVNTSSDFTGTVVSDTIISTTSITLNGGSLLYNTTYYWRVTAQSGLTKVIATAINSFTTKLAPASLTSPIDASTEQALNVSLAWSAVSGADNYTLEVNTASDFTGNTIPVGTQPQSGTSKTLGGLNDNTTYYWRVAASNSGTGNTSDTSTVISFTTAQQSVTGISPVENSFSNSLAPTLSWPTTTGADKYTLEVNKTLDFTGTVIFNDTVTNTSQQIGTSTTLTNNTKYFWRVSAQSNLAKVTTSSPNSFTTKLATSSLTSPTDASTAQALNVSLAWLAVAGADQYTLEVNTESDFTGTAIAVLGQPQSGTSKVPEGLSNNTTYYWRITASDSGTGNTSDVSSVRSFTTKLATVVLTSPADTSTGQPLNVSLSWAAVTGADQYTLEVNTASDFTGTAIAVSNQPQSGTSKAPGGLSDNSTYYWRVTASDSATGNISDVSSVRSFTTSQQSVTGISPTENSFSNLINPSLSWPATTGANKYRLEVNTAIGFGGATSVFDNSSLTTNSQALAGLSNNTKYYWRVTASSNLAKTNTPVTNSFTTQLAAPVLSPVPNTATGQALNVELTWSSVLGADRYTLEVNTASDFTGTAIAVSGQPQSDTSKTPGGLSDNTTYYWRVTASNSVTGNTSNASLVGGFITAPGPASDIFPPPNSFSNSLTPTLSWPIIVGADKFRLEVSASNIFSGTLVLDTTITTSSITLNENSLEYNTTYYWRVTAQSSLSKSTSSVTNSFTTKLATPILTSPANNTTDVSLTPTLTWSSVSGADNYRLEVNTNSDFTGSVIYDVATLIGTSQQITGLSSGTDYYWRVSASNSAGNFSDTSGYYKYSASLVTAVDDKSSIPKEFSLSQNYPNPFNPTTIIRFALPEASFVTLKIYNMLGQEIKTLVNAQKSAGTFNVQWKGDNNFGGKVASGTYIYRVIAGSNIFTKKMALLR